MRRRRRASSVPAPAAEGTVARLVIDEPAPPSPSTSPACLFLFLRPIGYRLLDCCAATPVPLRCGRRIRMADLSGRMIGAMQADVKTLAEIEADPGAMGQAVTVIVIAGVAALIGNIFRNGVIPGVMAMIGSLVG